MPQETKVTNRVDRRTKRLRLGANSPTIQDDWYASTPFHSENGKEACILYVLSYRGTDGGLAMTSCCFIAFNCDPRDDRLRSGYR
jgi:hypothetical protein